MDFARYSHSNEFKEVIGHALVDDSYARAHDFFGTNLTYVSIVVGRWNDDVQWYAQAGV
jgi:mannan endo-1,6-alpha-mannosidase